jgi:uncharacterized protein
MDSIEKHNRLTEYLKSLGNCVVAFSGGLDSTFLLRAAKDALADNVLAVTAVFPYTAKWELAEAEKIAREFDVRHRIIESPVPEEIRTNPPNRCYICKKEMFGLIMDIAAESGFSNIIEGTNTDDLNDYRPGIKALRELNIVSPLLEVGFTKEDIRNASREMGIPLWDKPAYPCLLTRLPHGREIMPGELERIEKSERYLTDMGFRSVRVRSHGNIARIECGREERKKLFNEALMDTISGQLKGYGYTYVTMELEGYAMGSMNEPESG